MIGLDVGRSAVGGVEKEAQRLGIPVSVAVVDPAGMPIVVVRMDGAMPVTTELALGKAFSAVYWQRATVDLAALAADRPAFFESLMATARRPLVPLAGGLLVVENGLIAGGIGVSGARTPEEDVICAQAGLLAAGLSLT